MAILEIGQFNPDMTMTSLGPVCISNSCLLFFEKLEKNYSHMINYGLSMMLRDEEGSLGLKCVHSRWSSGVGL